MRAVFRAGVASVYGGGSAGIRRHGPPADQQNMTPGGRFTSSAAEVARIENEMQTVMADAGSKVLSRIRT